MNNEPETKVQGEETGNNDQEKIFTQKDLDRIIGERLSRVKADASPELQEREKNVTRRELELDARERLMEAGLPKQLLGAINCSTKKDMENSIKVIQELYGDKGSQTAKQERPAYRVVTSSVSNSSNDSGIRNGADIRRAMGLKG